MTTPLAELVDRLVAGGMSAGEAAELVAAAIVTNGGPVSSSSGAERSRRWRLRKKAAEMAGADRVTRNVTDTSRATPSPSPSPPITPYPSPPSEPLRQGTRDRFEITPEAKELALDIAVIAGQDREFLSPQWMSKQPFERAQMWLNEGWVPNVMREAARTAIRRKRDGPPSNCRYFEPIFARAHAPQLPLPVVQVVHPTAEVVHVHQSEFRSRARGGESLAARSLRLARSSSEA